LAPVGATNPNAKAVQANMTQNVTATLVIYETRK
jgi:hypothetical protein